LPWTISQRTEEGKSVALPYCGCHRAVEFLKSLKDIDAQVPEGLDIRTFIGLHNKN
jgi:hypothetical protein